MTRGRQSATWNPKLFLLIPSRSHGHKAILRLNIPDENCFRLSPRTAKQLADVQVLVNGAAIPREYVSPNQINAVFPASPAIGLVRLTIKTAVDLRRRMSCSRRRFPLFSPSITPDQARAAAINGVTGTIVSSTNPLHSGDFLTIFLTGLGATAIQNGFEYAQTQPGITAGSQPCRVTFAGRAPTIPGVDQINCVIPDGVSGMSLPVWRLRADARPTRSTSPCNRRLGRDLHDDAGEVPGMEQIDLHCFISGQKKRRS